MVPTLARMVVTEPKVVEASEAFGAVALEEKIGWEFEDVSCPDLLEREVGETARCTATDEAAFDAFARLPSGAFHTRQNMPE